MKDIIKLPKITHNTAGTLDIEKKNPNKEIVLKTTKLQIAPPDSSPSSFILESSTNVTIAEFRNINGKVMAKAKTDNRKLSDVKKKCGK